MWLHSQSLLTLPIYFPLFVTHLFRLLQPFLPYGRSPGLVAMGGDSCFKGCEFESQHGILDEHFCTYLFAVKFVMFVWKDENKWGQGCSFKNTFLPSLSLSLSLSVSLFLSLYPPFFLSLFPCLLRLCLFGSSAPLFLYFVWLKNLLTSASKVRQVKRSQGNPSLHFFPRKPKAKNSTLMSVSKFWLFLLLRPTLF